MTSDELQFIRQLIEKVNRLEKRLNVLDAQEVAGSGGVTDHGALTGLADNDHPQYGLLAAANTWTQNQSVASTQTTGNALNVTRNLTSTSTDSPVVNIVQDHASDDQDAVRVQQDGTGDIVELLDGATVVLRVLDGGRLDIAQIIRALTSSGLRLEDDGGNLGIFIEDGGNVGIDTTDPNYDFQLGTGTITPGGFGGASAQARMLVTDTTSGKYTQLAIQGPTNGGGAVEFYDGSGNAVADFGMNTNGADMAFVNRMTSGIFQIYTHDGSSLARRLVIGATGLAGINLTTPLGQLHVDQPSTTAAVPVLILDQADLSEEFIEFTSTVGAGNPIDTAAIGAYYGKIRVNVTGVGYKYIALYDS